MSTSTDELYWAEYKCNRSRCLTGTGRISGASYFCNGRKPYIIHSCAYRTNRKDKLYQIKLPTGMFALQITACSEAAHPHIIKLYGSVNLEHIQVVANPIQSPSPILNSSDINSHDNSSQCNQNIPSYTYNSSQSNKQRFVLELF